MISLYCQYKMFSKPLIRAKISCSKKLFMIYHDFQFFVLHKASNPQKDANDNTIATAIHPERYFIAKCASIYLVREVRSVFRTKRARFIVGFFKTHWKAHN